MSNKLSEAKYYSDNGEKYALDYSATFNFVGDSIKNTVITNAYTGEKETVDGLSPYFSTNFFCYKDNRFTNKCDSKGRLISITRPDGKTEKIEYDEKDRIATYHNPIFLSTDKFYFYYNDLNQLVYNGRFGEVCEYNGNYCFVSNTNSIVISFDDESKVLKSVDLNNGFKIYSVRRFNEDGYITSDSYISYSHQAANQLWYYTYSD